MRAEGRTQKSGGRGRGRAGRRQLPSWTGTRTPLLTQAAGLWVLTSWLTSRWALRLNWQGLKRKRAPRRKWAPPWGRARVLRGRSVGAEKNAREPASLFSSFLWKETPETGSTGGVHHRGDWWWHRNGSVAPGSLRDPATATPDLGARGLLLGVASASQTGDLCFPARLPPLASSSWFSPQPGLSPTVPLRTEMD